MAVAFRAAMSPGIHASAASPMNGTEPAGTALNDVLVALAVFQGGAVTAPAGWTVQYSGTNASFGFNLAYIARGASTPALAWTHTGTNYHELNILGFTGVDTTTPIDGAAQVASASITTAPNGPAITPSTAAMVIAGGVDWQGSGTGGWTAPAGYTYSGDNTAANDSALARKLVAAGATEDPAVFGNRVNTTAAQVWSFTIGLRDASGGAPSIPPALVMAPYIAA